MAESMVQATALQRRRILRTRVDATSYRHTTDQVLRWAAAGSPATSAWPRSTT
jgi:hypothetical protein